MKRSVILGSFLACFFLHAQILLAEDPSDLDSVLVEAQQNLRKSQIDSTYWNFPAYLGSHYISQYYVLSEAYLGKSELFDADLFKRKLFSEQLPDGSWYATWDAHTRAGDLNATLLNYLALKVMGESVDSLPLQKARAYILDHGGIEKTSLFTKIVLSLLKNYSWNDIPKIPYFLFNSYFPLNDSHLAQWVSPHVMAFAYLKKMRVTRELDARFHLDELWIDSKKIASIRNTVLTQKSPRASDKKLLKLILSKQQAQGTWGGYTVSTLMTLVALEDYKQSCPEDDTSAQTTKARRQIESLYFKTGPSAYKGVLDDGRYWDTVLAGIAMIESGASKEALQSTAKFLVDVQQKNGGFPFGVDFEYAPDVDDTAEIVLFLRHFPEYQKEVRRAVEWLSKMQNNDGGWGAFAKNNNKNFILGILTAKFNDSAALFDESSVDVTAHVMEALGSVGFTAENSPVIEKALQYLAKTQASDGKWIGRWGVNYLYATSAAVVAKLRVQDPLSSPSTQRAIDWLLSVQNQDGGWGESTLSYRQEGTAGRGVSTPSQTAWVLLALIEAQRKDAPATHNAVQYLLSEFHRSGQWKDSSTVGTGHPGIVYMEYPSYPFTFPLIALARYAR